MLNKLLGVLLALLAFCAGTWILVRTLPGDDGLDAAAATLGALSPLAMIVLGLALILLGGLYLYSGLAPRRRAQLAFVNESGTVNIRVDAIRDFVAKLAPEFSSIVRMSPHVVVRRGRIDIIVGVRIQAGPQIHATCELLQQRVRERLITGLGITQVREIEVTVTDIVGEKQES